MSTTKEGPRCPLQRPCIPSRPFLQAFTGFRYFDQACGHIISIGRDPPLIVGCNATSPGVYSVFDPTTLACREYSFNDGLTKIDYMTPALDTDGVTHIGATFDVTWLSIEVRACRASRLRL